MASKIVAGFYTCPECQKLHTYSPGFLTVTCSCGAEIFQLNTTNKREK